MLAVTLRLDPAAGFGPIQIAGLHAAIAEHRGDVPIVVCVGRRRLLFGAIYAVEPSLDLEAKLRDLGADIGREVEVPPWASVY